MGTQLLSKAQIAKVNKLLDSEVTEWTTSTVHEAAWTVLTRIVSRGITIVSSQWAITFDIQVNSD
jgi:hypothetical protein